MKHRQADAQWPGYTYRRADSNAGEELVLVLCVLECTLCDHAGITYVDAGPCRSWSRIVAP